MYHAFLCNFLCLYVYILFVGSFIHVPVCVHAIVCECVKRYVMNSYVLYVCVYVYICMCVCVCVCVCVY